ncbi:MAG TPA: class I SAM-dependent methyltransferase [Terriglobia bacterium]|nr:class I SAM-dependent methyltransferase [Terriglobia bacterium]
MENLKRAYLPPAGSHWALPLYDPITKLTGADAAKRMLLDQAALRPSHRVLDIGCGTGTLALLIKHLYPDVEVVGLDPDPKALARARKKAVRAGVAIQFDQGFSDELPYPEASFDRVFSSFMFHHLHEEDRSKTLSNVRKVLVPGGSLHLLDMERPEADARGWWAGMLRSNPHLKDNSPGRVLELMGQAGFAGAKRVAEEKILFGLMRSAYYQATAG